jgi:phospholipid N-methyltransferase
MHVLAAATAEASASPPEPGCASRWLYAALEPHGAFLLPEHRAEIHRVTSNMIDPISAFGLAANILQFIELGYNVTVLFHQLLEASATDENLEIETIAHDMNDICVKLTATSTSVVPMSKGDKMLRALAKKGEKLAKELDTILDGLVVRSQGSKRSIEVLQKSLKVLLRGNKVKALQTRLAELRDEMVIRMLSVLEYGYQHTK